jgi:hypothetical protein
MATLSNLVSTFSRISGIPEATVFAYGRFAREANLIGQKGRGPAAATMTLKDAANLIIAVCGTQITREAPDAITQFRAMGGVISPVHNDFQHLFYDWLKPLGFRRRQPYTLLDSNFGLFLEFLISQAAQGEVNKLLRKIPAAVVTVSAFKNLSERYKNRDMDWLVKQHILPTISPEKALAEGEVIITIRFARSRPLRVYVDVSRTWDVSQVLLVISFFPNPTKLPVDLPDLMLSAQITQDTITALAFTLADVTLPSKLKTESDFSRFFASQNIYQDERLQCLNCRV